MEDKELNYIIFILGYDLLHDMFACSENNECDLVFDDCKKIAKDFVESEEYKNNSRSMYEMLVEYLKRKGLTQCLDCGHSFIVDEEYEDELGVFTVCPNCKGTFDIEKKGDL